ncbi:MAG: hypothetical protein FWF10_02840 [Clostridiales bacterium]|nr:hypothetical protein [Clostridiales bacterium]
MKGNFRLANQFETVLSKRRHENVFFDRFNSVFKGFYLVIDERELAEMVQQGREITFRKIPSTERFGSQDIVRVEFYNLESADLDRITEVKKMMYFLNSVIDTSNYRTIEE